MDLNTFLTIASILVGFFLLGFFLFRRSGEVSKDASQNNLVEQLERLRKELSEANRHQQTQMTDQMNRMQDQMQRGLTSSQSALQKQFSQSSQIIKEVTEKLTTLDQTNKQVLDFSSQLKNLQGILQNPKQRGILGEYWLETLLSNVLPPDSYKMQYQLGVDEKGAILIVDAAVFVRDRIISIDAKFSLENYNRLMQEDSKEGREKYEKELKADVKRRIDETAKYIRPDLGTMDFSFMFIPAEGVYYNLLNARVGSTINSINLIEYAFSKKVMIVSPTSFFAYLQVVLHGLRELQVEKSTKDILKHVALLGKHVNQFADLHDRLGKNLGTVVNQYNQSAKELKKIDKDVFKITSGEAGGDIEIEEVDRPLLKE